MIEVREGGMLWGVWFVKEMRALVGVGQLYTSIFRAFCWFEYY
jgi:hypothetical protein